MVDPVKILGSLLAGGDLSKGSGESLLKTVLGAVAGGSQSRSSGGGLGDLLGSVIGSGGQSRSQSRSSGGLGSLLGAVLGGQQSRSSGGGLGDLLGGLLGGGSSGRASSGGGGLDLGSLLGAALNQFAKSQKSGQAKFQRNSFEEHAPGMSYQDASNQATLMIRAMVNAAKADGRVDQDEQEKILGKLGQVTQDEINFVRNELSQPLDVDGFIANVPRHMGNQIYIMSLMAIDLDTNPEAQYLHQLAQGLGISPQDANQIHSQLGAPKLYS